MHSSGGGGRVESDGETLSFCLLLFVPVLVVFVTSAVLRSKLVTVLWRCLFRRKSSDPKSVVRERFLCLCLCFFRWATHDDTSYYTGVPQN